MSDDIDLSPEYIDNVCRAAPFADNDAGIPQMVALIRALFARLAEVEADNNAMQLQISISFASQDAAEAKLAKALEAAFTEGFLAGTADGWMNNPRIKVEWKRSRARATIAQIGEGHE